MNAQGSKPNEGAQEKAIQDRFSRLREAKKRANRED